LSGRFDQLWQRRGVQLKLLKRNFTRWTVPYPVDAGDAAPAFSLPTSTGKSMSLSDFSGRQLVLFFYPKDDTETCTKEAISFSEMSARFARRKVALLGVSRDPVKSHQKFVAKYGLKLVLGADEDGSVCEAFGVWQEKQLYGRKFMGIVRSTFLIGPDGLIREVWRNVRVAGHAEAVYDATKTGN
jgi:peroxiredoxin Q/BCP